MSDDGKVYVVVVTGKLQAGQITQFIENFRPLAQHVQEHEEGTLSYMLSVGGDDPDRLCIYERWGKQPHAARAQSVGRWQPATAALPPPKAPHCMFLVCHVQVCLQGLPRGRALAVSPFQAGPFRRSGGG